MASPLLEHTCFLREVYEDLPRHNGGVHLAGGFPNDTIWKILWMRLDVQLDSWLSTPIGKVRSHFTTVLAREWRGVLNQK